MPSRVKGVTGYERLALASGWELCATSPGAYEGPDELKIGEVSWKRGYAPSTVAACLNALGEWSLDAPARRFDAEDWWYRATFPRPPRRPGESLVLGFDGLATMADVWLNGRPLLSSENMFLAHECILDERLEDDNELVVRFRALDPLLDAKRPRPKWRAPMVEHQQLRWFRTTLLGRTPGWSPPASPVGPWRPVWLETRGRLRLGDVKLRTGIEGENGWVELECDLSAAGTDIENPRLVVSRNAVQHCVTLERIRGTDTFAGRLDVPGADLWWPHTHGEPALYEARLVFEVGEEQATADLGRIGFRSIALDDRDGEFELRVNGIRVFCRGACWTPADVVSLDASPEQLREALSLFCAASMNMLRVGGTMVYESEDFLDLCDEMGILVWQDFMFANMDYPADDETFIASVREEARQQLTRLAGRPSLTVLCGNSEAEQQAAMWGTPRDHWMPALFTTVLRDLAQGHCPDVPYWPSSAHGGAFPHQGNVGTTSYYGVGAYLRPLEEARRAEIRFATECLAFANVPESAALARLPGGASIRVHHSSWKARTPRDLGAGWDFDDVRDHYLRTLFGLDPLTLRYADHERYLHLSRVVSGEVMASTFGEWRRANSVCNGALIWFWRDLWPGAGWGIVDALGMPKAAYYYLRRALQPVAAFFTDEGGNGLFLHIVNERAEPITAELELILYREDGVIVAKVTQSLELLKRYTLMLPAADLFPGFLDLSYAYRFGPASYDVAVATLQSDDGSIRAQAFHFVHGLSAERHGDVGLDARALQRSADEFELSISTRRFARSVWIEADGFVPEDAYFHLAPEASRTVRLRRHALAGSRPLRGRVHALNALASARIQAA